MPRQHSDSDSGRSSAKKKRKRHHGSSSRSSASSSRSSSLSSSSSSPAAYSRRRGSSSSPERLSRNNKSRVSRRSRSSDRHRRRHRSGSSSRSSSKRHSPKRSLRRRSGSPRHSKLHSSHHKSRSPVQPYGKSSHHSRNSSPSQSKKSRRSRSRSPESSRYRTSKKLSGYSKSRSKSPVWKSSKPNIPTNKVPEVKTEEESMKEKLERALKAAASADAELKEKGLLPEVKTDLLAKKAPNILAQFSEQTNRAQAIADINSSSFVQQSFISSRKSGKNTEEKPASFSADAHTAAIFGKTDPKALVITYTPGTGNAKASQTLLDWKDNPQALVHESLLEDPANKIERWKKKLAALRRKKLNGESGFFSFQN